MRTRRRITAKINTGQKTGKNYTSAKKIKIVPSTLQRSKVKK